MDDLQNQGGLDDLEYFAGEAEPAAEEDEFEQLPPQDEQEEMQPPEPEPEEWEEIKRQHEAEKAKTRSVHYQPLDWKKYDKFLNMNEKKVNDLLTALTAKGYTALTKKNYSQWKDILGDTTYEDLMEARTTLLPEHIDLINLNLRSKAMLLAQLVTFAEMLKFIVQTNDQQMEELGTKHSQALLVAMQTQAAEFKYAMQEATQEVKGEIHQGKGDFAQIADILEKQRGVMQDLIAQALNIQNGLANAEAKSLARIEEKTTAFLSNNMDRIVIALADRTAYKFAKIRYADIQMKTHIIYVSGMVAVAVIFFLLGRYIH